MPELYSLYDRRSWTSVPNYLRFHHRFRGQRESQKINADINAFTFDLYKLYERFQNLDETAIVDLSRLVNGDSFNSSFYNADGSSPILTAILLEGEIALAKRVQLLRSRIRALEGQGS